MTGVLRADLCVAGGAENAGVENAGVENTGAKTYEKSSKQKVHFINRPCLLYTSDAADE